VLWAGTAGQPLLAATSLGRGQVVQSAFAPSQPALLAWASNTALWTRVLKQGDAGPARALPELLDPGQAFMLAAASDALSPLRIPSLGFWAGVLGVYALALGPGAFWLLRRWRREPWAWAALPTLSLVTTVSIYAFGASQRPSGMLTEGVGGLDLVGGGEAEAYGIRALMSPFVTNATVTQHEPAWLLPMAEENVRQLGEAWVDIGTQTTVSFLDVGRWGVRYAYSAGLVHGQGEVLTDLSTVAGGLAGTVSNQTPYPLHKLAVCWNGKLYPLGDLPPGGMATLNPGNAQTAGAGGYLSAYAAYNRDVSRGIGRPLGSFASAAGLLSLAADGDQALLVATADNSTGSLLPGLPGVKVQQAIASDQTLLLVRQLAPVAVLPLAGGVSPL
ncbi:MAG: hypothetical protein K6T31_07740, partial [Alicyclobacillus sp.]|nr:hypothetical protein [Alicyclobacillus sp.]